MQELLDPDKFIWESNNCFKSVLTLEFLGIQECLIKISQINQSIVVMGYFCPLFPLRRESLRVGS